MPPCRPVFFYQTIINKNDNCYNVISKLKEIIREIKIQLLRNAIEKGKPSIDVMEKAALEDY